MKGIFQPVFYQGAPGSLTVRGNTDYNMIDARMCLEGDEMLVGIPRDDIPMMHSMSKEEVFCKMEIDAIFALAQEKGFVFRSKPGAIICVPPGHVLLTKNLKEDKAVHGLRWLLPGTAARLNDCVEWLTEWGAKTPEDKIAEQVCEYVKTLVQAA